jgi:transposase-like protein
MIPGSVARVIGSEERLVFRHMMGFKAFHSAQATIAGIETAHMIRKGQLSEENMPAYKQFTLGFL